MSIAIGTHGEQRTHISDALDTKSQKKVDKLMDEIDTIFNQQLCGALKDTSACDICITVV